MSNQQQVPRQQLKIEFRSNGRRRLRCVRAGSEVQQHAIQTRQVLPQLIEFCHSRGKMIIVYFISIMIQRPW